MLKIINNIINTLNTTSVNDLKNIEFFKSLKFKKEVIIININIYWKIIVIISFILILISLYFNINFLQKISKELDEEAITNYAALRTKTIKKEKIKNALDYFLSREKKSIEIINSPVLINDPSL